MTRLGRILNVLTGIGVLLVSAAVFAEPPEIFTNGLDMTFVRIRPALFTMGSPPSESGRRENEARHRVMLTRPYYLQATEVTQGQWKSIMGDNPSRFKGCGDDCPVEQVSWNEVQAFIGKMNKKEEGIIYRLPTEAEWEFAARGRGEPFLYAGGNDIEAVAWYSGNSKGRTHPVGLKAANGLGLYDMSGNVYEWCLDWYGNYPEGAVTDPPGPSSGGHRVLRGGSWYYDERSCRVAVRIIGIPFSRSDTLGFRLAGQERGLP